MNLVVGGMVLHTIGERLTPTLRELEKEFGGLEVIATLVALARENVGSDNTKLILDALDAGPTEGPTA